MIDSIPVRYTNFTPLKNLFTRYYRRKRVKCLEWLLPSLSEFLLLIAKMASLIIGRCMPATTARKFFIFLSKSMNTAFVPSYAPTLCPPTTHQTHHPPPTFYLLCHPPRHLLFRSPRTISSPPPCSTDPCLFAHVASQ